MPTVDPTAVARAGLTKARFSGADFDTILDDVLARAQAKYSGSFNNFALSDLGVVLIESFAVAFDQLAFYLDRRATDTYLSTVRTMRNAAYLARQQGYKIGPAVSSSVDLTVSLGQVYAFDVPIDVGRQFRGPNNLIFEAARATTFVAGSGPSDTQLIPVYEGETITETFSSTGALNQSFDLRRVPSGKFIVIGSVDVTVDGSPWPEVDLLEFGATSQFEIGYADSPPALRFGDGVVGLIPVAGATITVTYVASSGVAGKVSSGEITSLVTPLVQSFTTIELLINNLDKSIGGDDAESLASIKANAGRVFKTRDVAVTALDYESLSGAYADPLFGRVAVAKAVAARSAASDLTLQNLLLVIRNAVTAFVPSVTAVLDTANATLTDLDTTVLPALATDLADIAVLTTGIDADLTSALTSARSSKNRAIEVVTETTSIQAQVTVANGIITPIAVGPDALTAPTRTALLDALTAISGDNSSIFAAATLLQSAADAEAASVAAAKDKNAGIGLDLITTGTELLSAETNRGLIATAVTSLQGNTASLATLIVDQSSTVNTACDDIFNHVDEFLADDCKANLVVVPILARDASGFYAAPSIGLIQSLQVFLEARKEVTQTVSVTSGVAFLVPAVLTIRLGVLTGFSESLTRASVEAVVDGILRDRVFGASLYVSEFYCSITDVAGVAFANVTINGNLDSLLVLTSIRVDAQGNLIIADTEVITKGTVTVNTEVVAS